MNGGYAFTIGFVRLSFPRIPVHIMTLAIMARYHSSKWMREYITLSALDLGHSDEVTNTIDCKITLIFFKHVAGKERQPHRQAQERREK